MALWNSEEAEPEEAGGIADGLLVVLTCDRDPVRVASTGSKMITSNDDGQ